MAKEPEGKAVLEVRLEFTEILTLVGQAIVVPVLCIALEAFAEDRWPRR